MSTYLNIALTLDQDADMLAAQTDQNSDNPADSMENLTNLLAGITSGTLNKGSAVVNVGGAPSSGTLTYAGQPVAAETFALNGVTFTYRNSGAVANEVNIGQQISESMTNTSASRVSAVQSTLTLSGVPAVGGTFTLCGYTFTGLKNLAVTVVSSSGNTVTVSSSTGVAAGDTLSQGGLKSLVTAVPDSTTITVADSGVAWAAGTAYSGTLKSSPLQFYVSTTATLTGDEIEAAWNGYSETFALATATNVTGTITFDSTATQGRAITAINTAAAINASVTAKVDNVVTASASGSVVTITSLGQGKGTLLYTVTTSATNTTAGAFAGGLDGTQYSYTL